MNISFLMVWVDTAPVPLSGGLGVIASRRGKRRLDTAVERGQISKSISAPRPTPFTFLISLPGVELVVGIISLP